MRAKAKNFIPKPAVANRSLSFEISIDKIGVATPSRQMLKFEMEVEEI